MCVIQATWPINVPMNIGTVTPPVKEALEQAERPGLGEWAVFTV